MKIQFVLMFLLSLLTLSALAEEKSKINNTTSADGVKIVFESWGKGKPAVVFVHGWTNPRSIWDDQLKHFSEKYQSVALDLAGSGESGHNRTAWIMAAFSDDVIAVIEELKLDEVVLVGFSMGASVVVETASRIPQRVKGVVVVDHMQNPEEKLPPQMIPVVDSMMMDLLNNMNKEKLVAMGFFKTNQDVIYERVKKLYPEGVSQKGWREALHENILWMNEDCIPLLQELKVPVHAINSDLKPTEVEIFRKYVPAFKAKIIPEVGHLLFWEKPEVFQQLLEESIQEFIR